MQYETTDYDTLDKAAMGLAGALILLGIVVTGILEILAGEPYGAAPVTNDAGEIVATPAIDPVLRTGLVILGLVVLGLWGLYRVYQPTAEEDRQRKEVAAD